MKKNFIALSFLAFCVFLISVSCKQSSKSENIVVTDTTKSEKVLQTLNNRIEEQKDNDDLYYLRGKLYYNRKNLELSFKDVNKALTLNSKKPLYYLLLSDLYFVSGQTRKSKETLEECLKIDYKNLEADLKLGELYLYVNNHEKSIEYLDNALHIDVHNAKAYFIKGMNFKEMGDTSKALSNFQTVVEQDPEYYNAYMQLGLLNSLKNNPIALQYFSTALKLNPTSKEVLYARAWFFQNNKQFDKAESDYDMILSLDPNYKEAYFNKGYISQVYLKQCSKAIPEYSKAIQSDSNYVEAYYMRGKCFLETGEREKAKSDFKHALEINPDFELASTTLHDMR